MKCPTCDGKSGWSYCISYPDLYMREECQHCKGSGRISIWNWLSFQFWNHVPVIFIEWYADFYLRWWGE